MNALPQRTAWLLSVAVNLLLFGSVWLLAEPILDSRDDFFLLYLLSGGWGNAPTELLHYKYGLSPLLTKPLALLFAVEPGINWYSLLLLGCMFAGSVVLAAVLLLQQGLRKGLLLFSAFFATILCWLLLRINFSAASIVLSMAGVTLLYVQTAREGRWWRFVPVVLLLVTASLLRMHTVALVGVATAPLWLALPTRQLLRQVVPVLGATALLAVVLHLWQIWYYEQIIPGWQQENAYREALFAAVNSGRQYNDSLLAQQPPPLQLAARQFFIDSSVTTPQVLKQLATNRSLHLPMQWKNAATILYWMGAENKWPLLLLVLLLLWLAGAGTSRQRWIAVITIAFLLLLLVVLRFALKLPPYLLLSLVGMTLLVLLLQLPRQSGKQAQQWMYLLLAAVMLGSGISQLRAAGQLRNRAAAFETHLQALAADTQSIFLLLHRNISVSDFPARRAPATYPLPHVLTQAHFINGQSDAFFNRHNIGADSLWRHPRLRVCMNDSASARQHEAVLATYLHEKWGAGVTFGPALPQFAPLVVKPLQWHPATNPPPATTRR